MSVDQQCKERDELPSGWIHLTMGDVGRWFGGGTPSKANPRFWTGGNIPWVSPKDMKFDIITDAQDHITEDAVAQSTTNLVEAGSVLVVVRSGILQHTLPVAVTQREVALNQDLKAVIPRGNVEAGYLALALKAFEQKILHTCVKTGTTVQSLNLQAFLRFQIPVAPILEQARIVSEIEKQFTRLEAGMAALRRVQVNLKRYRASVLKAACEGLLVPTEAELQKSAGKVQKEFEPGEQLLKRVLAERRRRWTGRGQYKEPATPTVVNLSPLPVGWTWATFEQISERVTVGFVGAMKHEYVASGVPFLRGQNVRENKFDPEGMLYVSPEFHQKLSKSVIRAGDLAVVRSGSVGVTCVIPDTLPEANCSDLVLIQRPIGFVPQYGAYFMNSLGKRHVEAGKVGVALTHFNTKSVATMVVPLPPLAEQKRIVAEVERRLSVVEELESVVSANLQRATRLRQSILRKAFTGNLVHQNPDDEPASALFKRLKDRPHETKHAKRKAKSTDQITMSQKPATTLEELMQRLDSIGGAATPERLLSATSLGDEVDTFFDILREGRNSGALIVPRGTTGDIKRSSNEN